MNTYEMSTSSWQSHLTARRMLQDAGLNVEPQDTVNLRGPRTGMGYGPIGDTQVYKAHVEAPNLDAIKAAIPANTFVDITFHGLHDYHDTAYLSRSMYLRGEWRA